MKKRILIIGNTNGLPGVKVDIEKYKAFFTSAYGGQWYDFEINEQVNVGKAVLLTEVRAIRSMNLDFLIVIFSGHGGHERETLFELNEKGETIAESELASSATRQLNIFDCCRVESQVVAESARAQVRTKMFSTVNTRDRYEQRIMLASPQEVKLYACAVGEFAYDTSGGGIYSRNLIDQAAKVNVDFKLVGTAHQEAAELTSTQFKDQHPEAVLPRLLSSQQLVIGIKP